MQLQFEVAANNGAKLMMLELIIKHLNELALAIFGLGFTAWAGVVLKSSSSLSKSVRQLETTMSDSINDLSHSVTTVTTELSTVRRCYEDLSDDLKDLIREYTNDKVDIASRLSSVEAHMGVERRYYDRRREDPPK